MNDHNISMNDAGIALDGYDVVAYFDGDAMRGNSEINFRWHGADWWFASSKNRDRFATKPQNYAPQFGGYCAFGMSFGKAAKADPEAFSITGGKLYLSTSPMVRRFWRWFGNPGKAARHWRAMQPLK